MSAVVSFQPRHMPARPTVLDREGRAELLFTCVFVHEGREFSFSIAGRSWAEAEARLASLRQSAFVDGELEAMGDIDIVPSEI